MSKPKVVILGIADWAGSAFSACRAINSVGKFECRHVSAYDHPYEYPKDILVNLFPKMGRAPGEEIVRNAISIESYGEAAKLLIEADIIHLWNSFPGEAALMNIGFPIDWRKLKVVTMTGSMYRDHHTAINKMLSEWNKLKLTVQDGMFNFYHEMDYTFIPHAVDVDFFKPEEKRNKTIGTYKTTYKSNTRCNDADVARICEVMQKYPDWNVDLNYSMPWKERIERLSRCAVFVQDISPYIGVWGRSSLEACALEIPTLQNYSTQLASDHGEKLGEIPIVKIEDETFEAELKKLMDDEEYRKEIGRGSREWVKKHFSFPVIGEMYSEVYAAL